MWNNIDDAESDGAGYTVENGVLKQQFQKNGNNYIGKFCFYKVDGNEILSANL